jgi:hypothetical protein
MDMVIFTGVESEEEFKHKRPLEYEGWLRRESWRQERKSTSPRSVGFTAILIGLVLLVLTLSAYFRE